MSNDIQGQPLGVCPFCKVKVFVAIEDGAPNGIIHAMPMCSKFESLDPVVFVRAMREAIERGGSR